MLSWLSEGLAVAIGAILRSCRAVKSHVSGSFVRIMAAILIQKMGAGCLTGCPVTPNNGLLLKTALMSHVYM